MRLMTLPATHGPKARTSGFTLPEVVISVGIIMVVFGAIITAYIQGSYRAAWTGYSLAAQAAGVEQLEAAKAAVWDPLQTPVMDQICGLTNSTSVVLALPLTGTNVVYATNYTTVTLLLMTNGTCVSSNYLVQVNTRWPFRWKNQTVYFTNIVADYYAPE
jgi:type II secretory pathway pseudopilin PulG